MPRASRRRRIAAPVEEVWRVVSDPYHLPRWWPRTARVENVEGDQLEGAVWTQVLETRGGRGVRADYRCVRATENERMVMEQQVKETPFERVLRASTIEILLQPAGQETEVTLVHQQKLRGLSRFGGPLMRRASGGILADALAGLSSALGDEEQR